MGKHQIIYTSCMRGINGINDGQQIYSYDASFTGSASDDVKGLFSYQVPSLEPGVIMTEALARMMPQSFIYRRLGDGSCAIALNTYLGRDYMGSAGRFGNYLSHAVICDESEMTGRPCEFFGSELLRDHMEFSEVNSSDPPPFLPEPVLKRGSKIDFESVSAFLAVDDRMDIFRKMLAAMLSFESARKRVVICDEPENIITWIAALQYVLPLKTALNVNFTTYEFDPSLSASQICGVMPNGSRYSAENAAAHFTFDFFSGIIPELETDSEFFDFIDMGMSMSYESIQAFHEFVSEKLAYEKADEEYYGAYALYSLFSDGLENLSPGAFRAAARIAADYASDGGMPAFMGKMLEAGDFILSLNGTYFFDIIEVLVTNASQLPEAEREQLMKLIAEKVISAFRSQSADETGFGRFYNALAVLSDKAGISIPCELMKESNRNTLIEATLNGEMAWKQAFITDILCEYILLEALPADQLSMEYQIGRLIGGIIQSSAALDANEGFSIAARILDRFSGEWTYLLNMTLNIESALYDIQHPEPIIEALWQHCCQAVSANHAANRQDICHFLFSYERYSQLFDVYSELLKSARSTSEARGLFHEQSRFDGTKYDQEYCSEIFYAYYCYLRSNKDADSDAAKRELMLAIIQKPAYMAFAGELLDGILEDIPIASPSKENAELLGMAVKYFSKKNDQDVPERLLLLASGMLLSRVGSKRDLNAAMRVLEEITTDKIDLTISVRDAEKYLDLIVPSVFAACKSADDLRENCGLFRFSQSSFDAFVIRCARAAVKESRGDKEFSSILVFLNFLFGAEDADRKEIGKLFSKFSKSRLESLDLAVKSEFEDEKKYLSFWEEIHETAGATNPLLNSIGNFFRKNR